MQCPICFRLVGCPGKGRTDHFAVPRQTMTAHRGSKEKLRVGGASLPTATRNDTIPRRARRPLHCGISIRLMTAMGLGCAKTRGSRISMEGFQPGARGWPAEQNQ